jgi:hypothetical protein
MERYYLSVNGGPRIGWSRTFASRAAALAAAAEANEKYDNAITARVAIVPDDWIIVDGSIGWLIGGPEGLPYQRELFLRNL